MRKKLSFSQIDLNWMSSGTERWLILTFFTMQTHPTRFTETLESNV